MLACELVAQNNWQSIVRKPPNGSVLWLNGLKADQATVPDFSGSANHGTITGATWTRLPSGLWVLVFDGDDYVSIPYNSVLNCTGGITIAIWVKPTSNAALQTLIGKPFAATHTDPYFDWVMGRNTTGTINFRIGATANTSTNTAPINVWTHVALTADGVNHKWYFNGVLAKTVISAVLPTNTNSQAVKIGVNADLGEAFTGQQCADLVCNQRLSDTDIAEIYQQTRHLIPV